MSFKDAIGVYVWIPFGLLMWLGVVWLVMDIRERRARKKARKNGLATSDVDFPASPD